MTDLPLVPVTIRLPVFYRSAGALLRELSRAVSRGLTRIRAESGLPTGSRLTLALGMAASRRPVEVTGTITSSRRRGRLYEMALRYDFEPARQRGGLDRVIARLRHEQPSQGNRRETRVPLALEVDAAAVPGRLAASLENLSKAGCRLELRGGRLPRVVPGTRVHMALRTLRRGRGGARTSLRLLLRLLLEVLWVGPEVRREKSRSIMVGGRFLETDAVVRKRLEAVLRFQDCRPTIRILKVVPPVSVAKGTTGRDRT